MGFDFGGQYGWCVVDGSLSWWLMGLTAIGLGWRFVDGLFMEEIMPNRGSLFDLVVLLMGLSSI